MTFLNYFTKTKWLAFLVKSYLIQCFILANSERACYKILKLFLAKFIFDDNSVFSFDKSTLNWNFETNLIWRNESSELHDPSVDVVSPSPLDLVVRRATPIVTRVRIAAGRTGRRGRGGVDGKPRRDGSRSAEDFWRISDHVKLTVQGTG